MPAGRVERSKGRRALAIAAVVAVAVAAVAASSFMKPKPSPARTPAPAAYSGAPPGPRKSFAEIFAEVSPAVVSVNAVAERPVRGFDVPEGHPLALERSAGSGFFISADGLVLTNNHVIDGASQVSVALSDGRELRADVLGRDESTDLAVLKVRTPGGKRAAYPFVRFEDRVAPRVGDWVIAIGNPFGLGGSATAGVVSGSGRTIGDGDVAFLQIDASINRGNSGGPTFDVYGRVIGVNTAIYSPSGGFVGIGFAVPAEIASVVAKELSQGADRPGGFNRPAARRATEGGRP